MKEKENERRGKRSVMAHSTATGAGDSLLERIPEGIFTEIVSMLESETHTTLCSLECVSRTLQSSVNKAFSSFSSVDLSDFSLDPQTFDAIRRRFGKIEKITLDCLRLNDDSIRSFLGPDVEELILLKCSSLSYKLLASIGKSCPNLRLLTLEFSGFVHEPLESAVFDLNLQGSFRSCQHLESLRIKVREGQINNFGLLGIYQQLPETVKILKIQPSSALDTIRTFTHTNSVAPLTFGQTLTHLSLALDCISDTLINTIAHNLPLLIELDLKDRLLSEPSDDLSDLGIQSLVNCKHLTTLSLMRSQQHVRSAFKRTTDMGMFLLSEGCKRLESVRLSGFSKVSDAGFTSILSSCLNLKKFEIQNSSLLTDLTFQDFSKVSRSLVEVKLRSCGSVTSDAVCELVTCGSLEVVDLFNCKSVSDSCLNNISRLTLLTTLNLGGADVTDVGMSILGKISAPISCLSLNGCRRVSDEGIILLLGSESKIRKTLLSLDLGYMSGLTDMAITTVANTCVELKELSIRYCVHVTDASLKALALTGRVQRLDLFKCHALSFESFQYLKKPLFRGLRWIGIDGTRLGCVGDDEFDEICRERQWLTICKDGCEVGCHDGWQFHEY